MMKKGLIITLLTAPILLCSHGNIHSVVLNQGATKTDIKTIKIGNQEWMATNLDVSNFKNGEPIPEAKSKDEWLNAYSNEQPAWSYYNGDPENGKKYGKLYNWYAVNDPRGLAPAGWHVPKDAEWVQLTTYLGGNSVAGGKLKSKSGWSAGGNGTNESAFDGLPGGARNFDGNFFYVGEAGYWWSSTELSTNHALPLFLNFLNGTVERNSAIYYSKGLGMSVRLLKD
jgi:uncharacterized protein (TIGR02145 family)